MKKQRFFVKKHFSEKVENCDILMFKNVKSSVSKMCGFSTLHGPYISILCTMLEKCSLKPGATERILASYGIIADNEKSLKFRTETFPKLYKPG